MEEISKDEQKETLHNFHKDKILGLNGWTIEFLLALYDTIGPNLLHLVEESWVNGHMHPPLKSTFIVLIPKIENLDTVEDFIPISLCNITYKVVSKIIFQRIKKVLSKIILPEQFGFLENRHIHEAIRVAQEGMHGIKIKKIKGAILKIDLSKDFDRVSWIYLRRILTHLGFN